MTLSADHATFKLKLGLAVGVKRVDQRLCVAVTVIVRLGWCAQPLAVASVRDLVLTAPFSVFTQLSSYLRLCCIPGADPSVTAANYYFLVKVTAIIASAAEFGGNSTALFAVSDAVTRQLDASGRVGYLPVYPYALTSGGNTSTPCTVPVRDCYVRPL